MRLLERERALMSTFVRKLCLGFGSLALGACAFGMTVDEYAELPRCSRLGTWADECAACLEGGDGEACLAVAEAHRKGEEARIGERTAELFAGHACQQGSSRGCLIAGAALARDERAYAYRGAIQRQYGMFCEVAAMSCERGNQGQCVAAAECSLDTVDRQRAVGQLEGLCVDGSARACTLAGDHAATPATAVAMYGRGCELGSAESCVGVAASEQLGLGVERDPDDARVKFTYACGAAPTFAACNAVAGYLPVSWLGRARLGAGLGKTGLPAPDVGRLAMMRAEFDELDRTAVAGFCLGDDGRAQAAKMLQTWGDPRVDEVILDAVRGGSFGDQTGVEHRCWWMTYRVNYR